MKTNNYIVASLVNSNDKTISVTARFVSDFSDNEIIRNIDNSYSLFHNNEYYNVTATNLSMRQAKKLKASILNLYINKLNFALISAKFDNKS